ncbi:MAG: bifunctional diaminohydroxyphosphoribosylaminopyrimidine deaminase/5-amino-6-(5-phosphoribosylamino)uracil reductase RibD [Gemmataceae bacterium]|nr:bifunctional diaminohydroxyphosphoribosylaminopyrimidine deaminase/5-amino-6-(5-phosphoribosylamino)uracil reductase RibD [Gemmataceae bacterium]
MPIDKATAIAQIDDVLKCGSATEESVTLACAALKRLAPPGSVYLERMEKALGTVVVGLRGSRGAKYLDIITSLHGTLKALRADYAADRLHSFPELIHAESLDDRQHAVEFQKMLAAWRPLRMASRTSIHTLARYEPADDQSHQARAILHALRAHGRPAARFVASQCGSSESKAVLWWFKSQLADNFVLDDESATRFDDISLIVDNALLQVETSPASERRFMGLAIEEARKSVAEDGRPHPKVGAVVIKDGKVIATAHRGEMAPGDHAEYTVLEKKLKHESLAGATVYATLEPCTRRGANRTPCAQRLIDRKVKRVVIGMLDPNPSICGKGQRLLQNRGIEVEHFPHDLVMQLEELNREFTKAQEAAAARTGISTGSARNPLHMIIDLLIVYNRAFVQVHQAGTDEARRAALDEWGHCHPVVWGSSSCRNDTIRTLADPAKAWLTRTNSRFVELQDFNLVEECVHALSSFAISASPMAMPEVYSKTYTTEQELWQRWNQQGEQVVELGNLIARLKELAARAGEAWTPAPPLARGAMSDANGTSDQRTPPQDPTMPSGQTPPSC